MSATQNKQTIMDMADAFNVGDIEKAFASYADDVEWTIIGTTSYSGTYRGKQDVFARLLGRLGQDLDGGLKVTVGNVIAEGDHVVLQFRGQATTRAGAAYDNTYCLVYRFAGGKIVEVTEYLDTDMVRRVLG